ncbi:MAG: LysR family transcriptional regulator [Lautropia sp.]
MDLDYRRIVHLATAARCGSLSAAAAELGVSQPALSKSIATLEAGLGVTLLERGRFGVRPTRFGEAIVERGNVLEAEMRGIVDDIAVMKRAASARLVIGCGPSEATRLLPQTLLALAAERPELKVTVLYGLNETLMPMVRRGDIEFALSSVPRTASDPDLKHEILYGDSAAVIARPDHPLARRRRITPHDLLGRRWVLARRRELERKALDDLFLDAGLRPPEPQTETTSAILLKTMVLQGEVLSFLPRELIHWEARAGQLVCLDVVAPAWERVVGVTTRRRGRPGSAARALVAALRAQCGQGEVAYAASGGAGDA